MSGRRKRTKEEVRANNLKSKYGLTIAQYDAMLEKQGHACGICGKIPSIRARRLCVDHNHQTGAIRGLLCSFCNRKILGVIEKVKLNPTQIVSYLERYK